MPQQELQPKNADTLASHILVGTEDWAQIEMQGIVSLSANNLPLSILTNLQIFFLLLLVCEETVFQYEPALDSLL